MVMTAMTVNLTTRPSLANYPVAVRYRVAVQADTSLAQVKTLDSRFHSVRRIGAGNPRRLRGARPAFENDLIHKPQTLKPDAEVYAGGVLPGRVQIAVVHHPPQPYAPAGG